jgi:hypothetical protein
MPTHKFHLAVLSIAAFLSLAACGRSVSPFLRELNEIEVQMVDSHDSAYSRLTELKKPDRMTDEEAAKYELLLVEGKYKSDLDVTGDTLISKSVDYYSKTNDHREYARALMYYGVVKFDSNDFVGSIEQYKKAEEQALKTTDWYLLGLINSRIGYVYSNVFDNDENMARDKAALAYYRKAGKADNVYKTSLLTGCDCIVSKQWDSALFYLNEAERMAAPFKDTLTMVYCSSMKADALNAQQQYRRAISQCLPTLDSFQVNPGEDIYYQLSFAYSKIGKADSAEYYHKLYEPNVDSDFSLLILGESIAEAKGDYKTALEYNQKRIAYADSITAANSSAKIHFIEASYNAESARREASIVANRYRLKMQFWALIASAFAIAIALLIIILQRRNLEMSRQKALIESLQAEKGAISGSLIGQLSRTNEEERRLSDAFDNRMKFIAGLVDPSYRYGGDDSLLLKEYKKSMDAIKADRTLLEDLRSVVDAKSGGLTERLKKDHPDLTEKEIDLICMVYCGLPTSMICFLMNFSSFESLATRKTQVRKKLGTDQKLEDFLKSKS